MVADYSMTDDRWEFLRHTIAAWFEANLEANPDLEMRKPLIKGLFHLGDIHPLMRKRFWASIRAVFADVPNAPNARRSSMFNLKQRASLNEWLARYADECEHIYNEMPCFQTLALPHSKSRHRLGTVYESAEAYAEDMAKKARFLLTKAFANHYNNRENRRFYWDGEYTSEGQPSLIFIDETDDDEDE